MRMVQPSDSAVIGETEFANRMMIMRPAARQKVLDNFLNPTLCFSKMANISFENLCEASKVSKVGSS